MLHSFSSLNICYSWRQTVITAKTGHEQPTMLHFVSLFIVEVLELAPCTHHWIAHFVWSQVCILCMEKCGVSAWLWSSNWTCFMWSAWLPNWSFTHTRWYFSHTCISEFLHYFIAWSSTFLSSQDYEEPLMFFSLNEEDEEDELLQPVCGKAFI